MKKMFIHSPFNREIIGSVKTTNLQESSRMLDTAYALYTNRDLWLATHERISILNKTSILLSKRQDFFAKLIAKEGGKPLVDAKIEVTRAIDGISLAVKELLNMHGKEVPMGLTAASVDRMAFTFKEPIGVVLAISAFNHPLNLIIHQVIPAIATGCPVIVKPASSTPLCCIEFVKLLYKAGLHKSWCQVCVCSNEVAEKLVIDNRISFLTFIGSAKVGWMLKSKLAPGVHCSLEHGGAAPVIIDNTVDLNEILPGLIKGGFYHAGQVCVSVQRIYVHKDMAEIFAKKIAEIAMKLKVGDPSDLSTDVGPLILPREVDRVHEWVEEAKSMNGKILCGGQKISATTYQPTVIYNPSELAKVSRLEIFGPVICIYPYADISDAIKSANSLNYAFQASVYSKNINICIDCAKKLNATAVMINDHTAFRVDWMPFGGRLSSGLGMGGIGYSMKDMMSEKLMVIKYSK